MAGSSFEDEFSARVADDPGHDSQSHASFGEHGSLLDMQLEKHAREWAARSDGRAASDAADLLAPEDHDGTCTGAADDVHCRDDAERTVEPSAAWDRIHVRTDPDPT